MALLTAEVVLWFLSHLAEQPAATDSTDRASLKVMGDKEAPAEGWSLNAEQRAETVKRVAANLATMAFFRNTPISDVKTAEIAEASERKAYNVAQVESATTTGFRPAHETQKAYLRCFT